MAQNISGAHQLGMTSKQVIILVEKSLEISITRSSKMCPECHQFCCMKSKVFLET